MLILVTVPGKVVISSSDDEHDDDDEYDDEMDADDREEDEDYHGINTNTTMVPKTPGRSQGNSTAAFPHLPLRLSHATAQHPAQPLLACGVARPLTQES